MGEKNSVGVNYFYRLLMTTSVAINRHALPAEVVVRTRAGNEPLFGWFSGPGYTSGNPLSMRQHTSILLVSLREPLYRKWENSIIRMLLFKLYGYSQSGIIIINSRSKS